MIHQTMLAALVVGAFCLYTCADDKQTDTAPADDNTVVIAPKRVRGPVFNPGKGWVSYGWPGTPPDHVTQPRSGGEKTEAEIALASVGYRRFEWGLLQPEEDRFDWTILDQFIKEWSSRGKQVAFGIMSANTHSRIEGGYVTPRWVFEAGVPERSWTIKPGGDVARGNAGTKREPRDWHHPVLMRKIDAFVAALAKRYDGHPAIAFIDIRSHSNWGETMSQKHAEIYHKHFKKTRLCQSVHGGNAARQAEWCVERGIALRRDGIGGSLGKELIPAINKVPAVFEFWGSLGYLESRGWWQEGKLIPRAIEVGHPTYVEIIRNSPTFLSEHRKLIDGVTNRIGYHFILDEMRYPRRLDPSRPFEMRGIWRNEGVSPIFVPCEVVVALVDAKTDKVIARSNAAGFEPAKWMPGKKVDQKATIRFANDIPNGDYRLALGLFRDSADEKPTYVLGSATPMIGRWHVLGPVHLGDTR